MRQPYKMVKHTQTICLQQPPNYLSVFDHFVGLALKGLTLPWCSAIIYCCVCDICFERKP